MAALRKMKLEEGFQLLKDAEEFEKTSWLKWEPDWDGAANKYMKAGTCFETAKSYDRAAEAFKKAADAHSNSNDLFHAAEALEQAASALKELENVTEAVSLVERAVEMYTQIGSFYEGTSALITGATMCIISDPAKAAELYISASEMKVYREKVWDAIEPLTKALDLLLKIKRFPEALNVMKQQRKLCEQVDQRRFAPYFHYSDGVKAQFNKTVLSMVVVHLHLGDYVAAKNCYQESLEIRLFCDSLEASHADRVLKCFGRGDADGLERCKSNWYYQFLSCEITKLFRSLCVPCDTGKKQKAKGQEESANEQVIDELQEGWLC